MVVDYSEKRGGRDTAERKPERKPVQKSVQKPVQKNRARKEPGGLFALLSVVALTITFGAGLGTGWFLFANPDSAPVAAAPAKKEEPATVAAPPAPPGPEAQLTFYQTLPAGGRGVIGSGLNLKKTEPALSAQQPASRLPAPATSSEVQQSGDKELTGEKLQAGDKQQSGDKQQAEDKQASTRFVVQIASYREKQEADKAQAKLTGKGMAAYVSESKISGNGVWYRIRIGRHLSRAEADELAGKAGKGAVVLAE